MTGIELIYLTTMIVILCALGFILGSWSRQQQRKSEALAKAAEIERKDLLRRMHDKYPIGSIAELDSYGSVEITDLYMKIQTVEFVTGKKRRINMEFWQFEEQIQGNPLEAEREEPQ